MNELLADVSGVSVAPLLHLKCLQCSSLYVNVVLSFYEFSQIGKLS